MKGRLIENKTAQEVFDTVVEHLMKQGKKSLHPSSTTCMYRGNNGLMCAVGVLIADDEYDEAIERNCWSDVVHLHGFTKEHCGLLDRLQEVHDEAMEIEDVGGFRTQVLDMASILAEEFDLDTTVLNRAYAEYNK